MKNPFNEAQSRRLGTSLRHLSGLLDEVERLLILDHHPSPFRNLTSDVAPWEARVISDQVEQIRTRLVSVADRFDFDDFDKGGFPLDIRRSLAVQSTMASITIEEMRSRYLKGYGAIDTDTARVIDLACDELSHFNDELSRFVSSRSEDFKDRIVRLQRIPFDHDLLKTFDRILHEYHLIDLRPAFKSLLERIEERRFSVALFGRVSSGKSSLLNAILNSSILPVGVTPITAVPTRVRSGSPAGLRVRTGEEAPQSLPLEKLAEFASERTNSGNRLGISRLEVVYPSDRVPEGVEFVDTPGIGALATAGAQETLAFLPRADLAIVLLDVGSSIGPDELTLVRTLLDAAIPVQLLLSKADLVDEPSLADLRLYVGRIVEKELGFAPEVVAVSSVPGGRAYLNSWLTEHIGPLMRRRDGLWEEAANRAAGALKERIVARLRSALEQRRDQPEVEPWREAALRRLAEAGRTLESLPETLPRCAEEVFVSAANAAADLWKAGHPKAKGDALLRGALEPRLSLARKDLARLISETLEFLSRQLEGHPSIRDLFLAGAPDRDSAGMPLLNLTVLTETFEFGPSLVGGGLRSLARRRALRIVRGRYSADLKGQLQMYAFRLRDWGTQRLHQLQIPFLNAIESAVVTDSGLKNRDRVDVERDLQALGVREPTGVEAER